MEGAVVSPRVRRDLIGSYRLSGNDRMVTVVCAEPGAYHAKRGRSVLATYVRHAAGYRPAHWSEARRTSERTRRKYREWHDGLSAEEREASTGPFPGSLNAGLRPATTIYLRGNIPAADTTDAYHIEEALSEGTRTGANGTRPAEAADLAARGNLYLTCGCGLSRRAHRQDVWPILDIFADNRIREISLRQLIDRLAGSARRKST